MRSLLLLAFSVVFGVYALGVAGILDMSPNNTSISTSTAASTPAAHQQTAQQAQATRFTDRIVAEDTKLENEHRLAQVTNRYVLKSAR